ncbi:CRPV-194 [Crowpox virus]|nr:CRPV-194 [Crowpox virus]
MLMVKINNVKDNTGKTPLHYSRNHQITKLLIQHGADINA